MTSSASSAAWLPAAIASAAVMTTAPAHWVPTGGRHSAPDSGDVVEFATAEPDAGRPGRHAEPEWARPMFDPERDEIDAFAWLGFAEAR